MKNLNYRMLAAVPPEGTPLCALGEISDGESRVFSFREDSAIFEMFVLRAPGHVKIDNEQKKPGNLYAYVNDCPHTHTPLDWTPGQFLDTKKNLLLCATHGALFRIGDGLCIEGPCLGKSLTPVDIFVENDLIHIGKQSSIIEAK